MLAELERQVGLFLVATSLFSVVLFALVWVLMTTLYRTMLCRWRYVACRVEKLTRNGSPLIKKYGIWGLVFFVAVPIPGTGVLSGTILGWLMGIKWWESFLAIVPAAALSNVLTTAGIVGLLHVVA